MAERFQRLFSLEPNQYSVGCPIIIEAGAIQKDTVSGRVLAQLKMKNIGAETITSCKVKLKAYENNGNEVSGVDEYSYLDLDAKHNCEFGGKTPIFLPDNTSRSFSVSITEIVYENGHIDNNCYENWKQMQEQKKLEEMLFDPELIKQYCMEVHTNSKYIPVLSDGLFQCTCGDINLASNQKCEKCGATYDDLITHLNVEALKEKANNRISAGKVAAKNKIQNSVIVACEVISLLLILCSTQMITFNKRGSIDMNNHTLLRTLYLFGKDKPGYTGYPGGALIGYLIVLSIIAVIIIYVLQMLDRKPTWLNKKAMCIITALPLLFIVLMLIIGVLFPPKSKVVHAIVIGPTCYFVITLCIVALICSCLFFRQKEPVVK